MANIQLKQKWKSFPMYVSRRKEAVLHVPQTMTVEEFELLKMQVDQAIDILRQTSIIEPEQPATSAESAEDKKHG